MPSLALCLFITPTAYPQVSFSDSNFNHVDWDITFLAHPQPPSGGIAVQVFSAGNFFQRIDHNLGGIPTPSQVLSIHINNKARFNPTNECAITSVNYSERAWTISTEVGTFGAGSGPALRQNGLLYVADFVPTRANPNSTNLPSPPITNVFVGLTANDFRLVLGPGNYDSSRHPDFSRTGGIIEFGFARANSHLLPTGRTRVTAIDDWNVLVGQDVPVMADFGDAPDGSLMMPTGYYGFTSVDGRVFFLAARPGLALFPTVRTNWGPFTATNELFIAPLPGSFESDAIGPTDQDGVNNLNLMTGLADFDLAEPGTSRLVIFGLATRAPALFFTLAASAAGGPSSGYWTAGFDMNQDGEWGAGEWVVDDIPFNIAPGGVQLLASRPFPWGPPGQQFGRLTFPVWARNMVTLESVAASGAPLNPGPPGGQPFYAGAGPPCGFANGEVEDLFLEWFPIGQLLGFAPGVAAGMSFGPDVPEDHLASIRGPERIPVGFRGTYHISGPPLEKLVVTFLPNGTNGGAAGPLLELPEKGSRSGRIETVEFAADIDWLGTGDKLHLTVERAPANAAVVVYGEPANRGIIGPGVPSGPNRTPTFGGAIMRFGGIGITNIQIQKGQVLLEWIGGQPPYIIQKAPHIGGTWTNELTNQTRSAAIPIAVDPGYFRVVCDEL